MLSCVHVFHNLSEANNLLLYPKASVIFKKSTEMEHWLEMG